jgi:hypothetical protein
MRMLCGQFLDPDLEGIVDDAFDSDQDFHREVVFRLRLLIVVKEEWQWLRGDISWGLFQGSLCNRQLFEKW